MTMKKATSIFYFSHIVFLPFLGKPDKRNLALAELRAYSEDDFSVGQIVFLYQ